MVIMQATVELPESILRQLETLAMREGATPSDLIRRIVEDHVARCQPSAQRSFNVSLPLIPASETGPIRPITGEDVDVLLSNDHLPA
jgi:Ribbon-helix-helix protein, copG family